MFKVLISQLHHQLTEDFKNPAFSFRTRLVRHTYMQSPIIRNGPIRLGIEFWGKFKKRALGRSNLRNA